jgi:hypothetical protein
MQDERSQPQPPEEISRREWMGKATISIGGVIGLTLAIPTMGALGPDVDPGRPVWTGMDESAWTHSLLFQNVPASPYIRNTRRSD